MREDPKEVKKRTKLMDKGKEQRHKGKTKDAVKTFSKVTKQWPGFPLAHVSLGELYLADGKLEDAEAEFRAATSGDRQHYAEQLHGLAEVFRKQGKEEERADALKLAREVKPLRMYMGKGQATGKLAGVWTDSTGNGVLLLFSDSGPEIALRFSRDYWPVVDSRVTVEFSGGDALSIVDSRGAQQIKRSITSAETSADRIKLMGKGNDQRKKGNTKDAIKAYKEVLKKWPGYPLAHVSLGELYLEEGEIREAEAEFRAALAAEGRYFAEPWRGLAEVLKRQGKTEEAEKALEIAGEMIPLRK